MSPRTTLHKLVGYCPLEKRTQAIHWMCVGCPALCYYTTGRVLIMKAIPDVACVFERLRLLSALLIICTLSNSYSLNHGKEIVAPSEGFRDFNFINPDPIHNEVWYSSNYGTIWNKDFWVWVLSKFNGTSTPKGSYRAKTGDNDCNVKSLCTV